MAQEGRLHLRGRVTQRSVAEAAGVHNATVSLALRNSPIIPEATRERIKAIAQALGYRPDPALQALASYRKGMSELNQAQRIAFVSGPEGGLPRESSMQQEAWLRGITRKALELGYQTDVFSMEESGMSGRRLCSILYSRGISGVILTAGDWLKSAIEEFAADQFSLVCIGNASAAAGAHIVASDIVGALGMVLRRVFAAGYVRPGLVLPRCSSGCESRIWSLAFEVEVLRCGRVARVPVLDMASPEGPAILPDWVNLHQPDVILGVHGEVAATLAESDLHIPADLSFIDISGEVASPAIAGLRHNQEQVGMTAMDVLGWQMHHFRRGLPQSVMTTLVAASWKEGASFPLKKSAGLTREAGAQAYLTA